MKKALQLVVPLFLIGIMFINPGIAADGGKDGIELCLKSVIPALFPFIFLTTFICSHCVTFPILPKTILRWLGIPEGAATILALGLIGGYPIGARCIAESCKNGSLSTKTSHRMLGFCNNAGPSFIFGILSNQFSSIRILWLIWCIQITSALLVGFLLPHKESESVHLTSRPGLPITQCLNNALKTMVFICGWIVLFRILCAYISSILPAGTSSVIIALTYGILELTNGCFALSGIVNEAVRFVICNFLLCFGGLCITMQTGSVLQDTGFGMYFIGKVLQSIIAILLSASIAMVIF
jgi:hypothetical protein